ncbi:restriction endonuclease subunit S [Campylobacter lari]|nr:restriction endonuclease subunit S [Campylobacter lari]
MKNFKDSGIEWLGEIPQHWKLIKCKNFFVLKSIPIGDLWNKTKLLSLTLNGVIERDINNTEGKFPSDFSTYQIVKEGDLIFCLFDVAETPRTIGLSKLNGMITSAYTIFEIKNQEKRFLEYFFINLDNRKNLKFLYRGLRNTISKEDLLNLKIPLPPLKEQEQIANFLDKKCEQIKNFIEKKEKLINLLKEQKQALINETITKGLDKNVNFKDSGIEWLGEIPQHWEIRKLKYIISDKLTYGANETAELSIKEYPRYIRITDFDENGFLKNDTFKSLPLEIAKNFLLNEGDILFARSGATVGKTFHFKNYQGMACYAGYLIKASINQKIALSDYIFYYTKSYYYMQWKELILNKATIENIGADKYSELKISFPPLKEQEQITNFLDEKCKKIDLLIEKTEKQIKLIKEYKTTLINQAVCGRINL